MIKVQDIINSVRRTLRDDFAIGDKSFSDDELIDYINRASAFVPTLAPSATSTHVVVDLVAGVSQKAPDDCIVVMNFLYNDLADTKVRYGYRNYSGKHSVAPIDLSVINQQMRGWVGHRASPLVVHCVYDRSVPKEFMVYPPNDGKGKLALYYSKSPAKVSVVGDNVALATQYEAAIMNHVMYSCLVKDNTNTGNLERARGFYALATSELSTNEQSGTTISEDSSGRN